MNFSRREILKMFGTAALLLTPAHTLLFGQNSGNPAYFKIISKIRNNGWQQLKLNQLITNIAMEFIDVPYVGGTLDANSVETCSVFLDKLDCVTYFETVLGIAKCIKSKKYDFDDLVEQVKQTRYRNGIVDGYSSRLHYTADWIYENTKNNITKDITKNIGGEIIKFDTFFMSKNFDKYNALKDNPELVRVIKQQEEAINSREYYYIPKNKLSRKISGIESGDIIAITTSIPGLDYAHIGFAFKNDKEEIQLLHASSKKKKVVLDIYLSEYLKGIKNNTGITVLRSV
ncbi:MAG: DUF1460 domain-containing protein [Candidatus Kapabacteria bacterium]|nr:DUF1460 domain-containing protein [Ignavibacteriota bacterium]MCW5885098.1 DUF1460 domain-containing protein [Candidatus Kapabacteria bacterium]